MSSRKDRVCPVRHAAALDSKVRRWVQDPAKIVGPYVREGMTVLDFGCGPGFFTVAMAEMVGRRGKVIAADLQGGMLEKVRAKIQGTHLEDRIRLHKCGTDGIGFVGTADLVFAFYVLHEVPDPRGLLREIHGLLCEGGYLLIVEPRFVHVSRASFERTIGAAVEAGFERSGEMRVFLSRGAALRKACAEANGGRPVG